jgi:RNA polymerase sigma-70 factor (ECF subfamily)
MILMILPDLSTEDLLLKRLRRGDEKAVIAVYEQYFPPLYQYARLKVGDSSMAEDIVSDVFVILIESLGTRSAPRKNLRGWLFTVARNEIYRTYGKVRHLPLTDVEEWMPASSEQHPEKQATTQFDIERVRHALRMLTADHQEVLILRFGQQLPIRATADIMGKSVSAIKSLQFRALETLRGILVEEETTQ